MKYDIQDWLKRQRENALWFLVGLIPYSLRYWTVIRAGADASTGKWAHVEAPGVTVTDILQRMR